MSKLQRYDLLMIYSLYHAAQGSPTLLSADGIRVIIQKKLTFHVLVDKREFCDVVFTDL
jgi:hypothetical protein